jgi:hypothetical protein
MARQVERPLRGLEQHLVCDVCRRTMLKGERPEPYLAPSRERKLVCQLCAPRAQKEGWIRESGDETPVQPPRPSERGRFLRRRRRRAPALDADATAPESAASRPESEPSTNGRSRPSAAETGPRVRDPRHVRAVPTSVELKLERAIQLFNRSEHPKTVAGIARTLGAPRVSATTSEPSPAEVILTVAWELSWYQYSIDLSDTNTPVREHDRGHEIDQLLARVQEWNAAADEDGRIALGEPEDVSVERPAADSNGEPAEDDL